jgi:hypothetical protein
MSLTQPFWLRWNRFLIFSASKHRVMETGIKTQKSFLSLSRIINRKKQTIKFSIRSRKVRDWETDARMKIYFENQRKSKTKFQSESEKERERTWRNWRCGGITSRVRLGGWLLVTEATGSMCSLERGFPIGFEFSLIADLLTGYNALYFSFIYW